MGAEHGEDQGEVAAVEPDENPAAAAPQIIALQATVAALEANNVAQAAEIARLNKRLAERAPFEPEWSALKCAPRGPFSYECIRRWCVGGLVVSEKRNGRRFVHLASLRARLMELAAR